MRLSIEYCLHVRQSVSSLISHNIQRYVELLLENQITRVELRRHFYSY